jgi:hypothetical protein
MRKYALHWRIWARNAIVRGMASPVILVFSCDIIKQNMQHNISSWLSSWRKNRRTFKVSFPGFPVTRFPGNYQKIGFSCFPGKLVRNPTNWILIIKLTNLSRKMTIIPTFSGNCISRSRRNLKLMSLLFSLASGDLQSMMMITRKKAIAQNWKISANKNVR